jgi:hypothetical protein
MRVRAPDGKTWVVRRRWMPKRPRFRNSTDLEDLTVGSRLSTGIPTDFAIGFGELGPIGVVVGLVVGIAAALLFATFIVPILAFTVELVIVALLFLTGAIGRLVLGRPWRVEAVTTSRPRERREIQVAGLRASAQAVKNLAKDLEAGHQRARLVP